VSFDDVENIDDLILEVIHPQAQTLSELDRAIV
jgi:hypothetical protein